jgi:hypothetical protein
MDSMTKSYSITTGCCYFDFFFLILFFKRKKVAGVGEGITGITSEPPKKAILIFSQSFQCVEKILGRSNEKFELSSIDMASL